MNDDKHLVTAGGFSHPEGDATRELEIEVGHSNITDVVWITFKPAVQFFHLPMIPAMAMARSIMTHAVLTRPRPRVLAPNIGVAVQPEIQKGHIQVKFDSETDKVELDAKSAERLAHIIVDKCRDLRQEKGEPAPFDPPRKN